MKNGDPVKCIQTWRGEGDYLYGGTAAFKKDETYILRWSFTDKDGTIIYAVESGMGSPDILYSNKDPKFSDYFEHGTTNH